MATSLAPKLLARAVAILAAAGAAMMPGFAAAVVDATDSGGGDTITASYELLILDGNQVVPSAETFVIINPPDDSSTADLSTCQISSAPSIGLLSPTAAADKGEFTYTPGILASGEDAFAIDLHRAPPAGFPAICDSPPGPLVTNRVFVILNTSPTATGTIGPLSVLEDAADISGDISGFFSDPDVGAGSFPDALTYAVTPVGGDASIINASMAGSTLTLDFLDDKHGSVTLRVTATDNRATGTFGFDPVNIFRNVSTTSDFFDFTVTIDPVDDAPLAADDAAATDDETPVTVDVFTDNGSGADTIVDVGPLVITSFDALSANGAAISQVGPGQLQYTPLPNFDGVDSFDYQVADGNPVAAGDGASATATVSVTVSAIDDAPTAADDAAATNDETPVTVDVFTDNGSGADTIVDLGPLVITSFDALSANGAAIAQVGPGQLQYTPVLNFDGVDTFDYQVADGDPSAAGDGASATATVSVTVSAIDDAPTAADDAAATDDETPVTVDVFTDNGSGADTIVDLGPLVITSFDAVSANGAAIAQVGPGQLQYTPVLNFDGVDTFDYQVADGDPSAAGDGASATATVSVTVSAIDDAPSAADDAAATDDETPVTVDVFTDNGSGADAIVDVGPLVITSFDALSANGAAISQVGPGQLQYTPVLNFDGVDTFDYQVADGDPAAAGDGASATATVSVTVSAIDDAPTAADDAAATDDETPVTVDVFTDNGSGADTIVDVGPLVITSFDGFSANGAAISQVGPGQLQYTPVLNFDGVDTFDYQVADGDPGSAADGVSATATVSVTVSAIDDAPTAADDAAATDDETPVTVDVFTDNGSGADTIVDVGPLVITSFDALSANGAAITQVGPGQLQYTPVLNFDGVDTFDYQVADGDPAAPGDGASATATVSVTVSAIDDAPTAADDAAATDDETPVTVDVFTDNGSGADTIVDLGPLVITSFDGFSANGAAISQVGPGQLQYTPVLNFDGVDTFDYQVADGDPGSAADGVSATATVSVTVSAIDDAPTAADDAAATDDETPVTVDVFTDNGSGVDAIVDVGPLVITSFDALSANGAAVAQVGPGQLQYTPVLNFDGVDTFDYQVADGDPAAPGDGASATATVSVTVSAIDDAPTAADDAAATDDETPVTVDVFTDNGSGADTIVDLGPLVITSFDAVSANGAAIAQVGPGQLQYTPVLNFDGVDTFDYQVADGDPSAAGDGASATATVSVTVSAIDDAPSAADDAAATDDETPVTVDVFTDNGSGADAIVDVGPLVITSFDALSANGAAISQVGPGQLQYTPVLNFDGVDTFDYQVADGDPGSAADGVSATATVSVTVSAIDDAPSAADDAAATDDETPVTVDVFTDNGSGADAIVDVGPLVITSFDALSANGAAISQVGPGQLQYTPVLNFDGVDTFDYQVADGDPSAAGDGASATATVAVTVSAIDDAPIANADGVSAAEEAPLTIDVFADNGSGADAVVDIGPLAITTHDVVSANGGSIAPGVNPGELVYTSAADFFGTDSFQYTIADGDPSAASPPGQTATATVTVTVADVDDQPIAVDDDVTTNEDNSVTISVFVDNGNGPDSSVDANGSADLVINSVSGAANGSLVNNFNGTVTYTPAPDFYGIDSFTYTIEDGTPGTPSAPATVTITVIDQDDDPVAQDDAVATSEETPVDISVFLDNGSGPDVAVDSGALEVTAFTQGSDGTVTDLGGGVLRYLPDTDFFGIDTFTYDLADGNGAAGPGGGTVTATVTVNVGDLDDAPIAVDDAATTDDETPVTISVFLDNGSGADQIVDSGPLVITNFDAATGNGGTIAQVGPGQLEYTPALNFHGLDTFTYDVADGDSTGFTTNGSSATATVSVDVTALDDAPIAVNDAAATDDETPVTIDVFLDNGSGADQIVDVGPLLITSFDSATANGGAISQVGPGQLEYTPALNFHGIDTFTYDVADGDPSGATANGVSATATVSVDVTALDDAPIAIDDAAATDDETPVVISVFNDNGSGADTIVDVGPLVITNFDLTTANGGTIAQTGPGQLEYTPALNFHGIDTFTYDVADGDPSGSTTDGGSSTATVSVDVTALDDAPIAVDDAAATDDETPVTVDVFNDNGSGADQIVDVGPLAIASFDLTTANGGVIAQTGAGQLQYTPALNFHGVDTFTYDLIDGDPSGSTADGSAATATVSVTVSAIDDAPLAFDDFAATDDETPVTISVFTDSGSGADQIVDIGPLVITSFDAVTANGGAISQVGPGQLQYTPALNFHGIDTFSYDVADGDPSGATANGGSTSATVSVDVTALDDPPIANGDALNAFEDAALSIDVFADNGSGADVVVDAGPLVITAFDAVTTNGGTVTAGSGTGELIYTSAANYFGPDSFQYTIADGDPSGSLPPGQTATATVTLTVADTDDAPVASDDTETTDEEAPVTIDVRANDTSIDSGGAGAIIIDAVGVATPPANGNVITDGSDVFYAPDPDFYGTDTFSYTIIDPTGTSSDTANVTVTVNNIDDAPRPEDDAATILEDNSLTGFDPLANDVEVDGGTLSITDATVDEGTVTITGTDTTLDYVPDPNFFGTATITYTVRDSFGTSDATALVVVTVDSANDEPIANDESITVTEDDVDIVIDVLANDYLFDAPVVITSVGTTHMIDGAPFPNSTNTTPTTVEIFGGDFQTLPNGSVFTDGTEIVYSPKPDYSGSDFFTYTITDADGETSTGTVNITITAVNDPPEAPEVQNYASVDQDNVLTIAAPGVLSPAFDADGDDLTAALQDFPTNGTVVLNPDGGFTYTPNIGYFGTDEFSFFVDDGTTTNVGAARRFVIEVDEATVVVTPPDSGDVEDLLPLAQVPLELVEGVDPNVLILMDDSGSMDFSTATNEERAVFNISNATSTQAYRFQWGYEYVVEYANSSYFGRGGVPSEETLERNSYYLAGNDYGVWRARNSAYNQIYYDPQTYYRPWRGLAPDGSPFPDADPENARLNPTRASDGTIDLTDDYGYYSRYVPVYARRFSYFSWLYNSDYYIPRYYKIVDPSYTGGPPAHDVDVELIEIRPNNERMSDDNPYTSGGNPRARTPYDGGADRTDCAEDDGDPLTCTYEQEIDNFANWFVYYRSREYTVKASLGRVVADANGLNIGYATINRDFEQEEIAPMETSFRDPNKRRLLDQIYRINSSGGTPLRPNLRAAGRHFECRSGDIFGSGSDSSPGDAGCPVAPAPAGLCQQQFTLLFTDGVWGSGFGGFGNKDRDNGNDSVFDGGIFADNESDTLGDIAMHYYERDLFPSFDNLVPTTSRDRALAPEGSFENNDETMHQHMTTFTVGFGVDGNLTDADIPSAIDDGVTSVNWGDPGSDNFAKIDDLRHAALNGRGDYLSAANPTALEQQLTAAFDEFASGVGAAAAVAFNSQQLRADTRIFRGFYDTDDNTGDLIAQELNLVTNELVEPPVWSAAERLDNRTPASRIIVTYDKDAGAGTEFDWPELNTAQRSALDPNGNPNGAEGEAIVDYLRGVRSAERPLGPYRERPLTGGILGDIINSTPVFVGPPLFIQRDALSYPLAPNLYSQFKQDNANRDGVVYVGSNDGMLHGFRAETGVEVFAYVPDRIIRPGNAGGNDITRLAEPNYEHRYYVDGTPAINDVFIDPNGGGNRDWRTVLVGTLRAGGKGLFAIDVTDPSDFSTVNGAAGQVLWEFTDEDDEAPLDADGDPIDLDVDNQPVKDLGFTYSQPTLTMTNILADGTLADPEHKWAAVFGNGYNSTRGESVLYIVQIENGADGSWDSGDVIKLNTGFGPAPSGDPNPGLPNGLGQPRLIDLDNNGTVDYVYAGDLRGNMFRFDLTSGNPNAWSVTRLFRATYSDGTPQPITSQPIVTRNPQETGVIVIFATGSFFTDPDGTSTDIQSIYGIWDRIASSPFAAEAAPPTAGGDRSLLVEQEIINLFDETFGPVRTFSNNNVQYDVSTVRGWYVDLDAPRPSDTTEGNINPDTAGNGPGLGSNPQFPGERAVRNLQLRGGFLFVNTVIPRDNLSCEASPGGFAMAFNPVTGGIGGLNADVPFDLDNDGSFGEGDMVDGTTVVAGMRFDDAVPTDSSFIGTKRFTQLSDRTVDIRETNTGVGSKSGRLSWREL